LDNQQRLVRESQELETKEREMGDIVDDQVLKMRQLEREAEDKAREAGILALIIEEDELGQEGVILREEIENARLLAERARWTFQREMDALREEFGDKMKGLQAQLAFARDATLKTSRLLMMERTHAFQEIEMELAVEFGERERSIRADHEARMKRFRRALESARIDHREKIEDLQQRYEQAGASAKVEFEERMEELREHKANLDLSGDMLDREMDALVHKECEKCVKRKNQLRLLIEKRQDLMDHIVILKEDLAQVDDELDLVFPGGNTRKSWDAPDLRTSRSIVVPKSGKGVNPLTFPF
jgi:hypothetical protein